MLTITEKYAKEEDITYFSKREKTTIEEINVDEIVYIKVKSRLNYGIREWEYYGKIIKKTKCYFWLIEYFNADVDNWKTKYIKIHDEHPIESSRKWAKKSVIEIWRADTAIRKELREYGSNYKKIGEIE